MQLKSNFNCGQQVWHRFIGTKESRVKCEDCGGDGYLVSKSGSNQSCRECYGHGYTSEWIKDVPVINGPYTIGQIRIIYTAKSDRVSDFSNFGKQKEETKVEYMVYETGIGSGQIYYEDSLFATKEEAEQFREKGK